MAQRREAEPLVKITLNLYAADVPKLQSLFPTIGYQKAVRKLIRQFIQDMDRKVGEIGTNPVEELDLE